jgi:hypothetical protein
MGGKAWLAGSVHLCAPVSGSSTARDVHQRGSPVRPHPSTPAPSTQHLTVVGVPVIAPAIAAARLRLRLPASPRLYVTSHCTCLAPAGLTTHEPSSGGPPPPPFIRPRDRSTTTPAANTAHTLLTMPAPDAQQALSPPTTLYRVYNGSHAQPAQTADVHEYTQRAYHDPVRIQGNMGDLSSTVKGIMIGIFSVLGAAGFVLIIAAIVYYFRYTGPDIAPWRVRRRAAVCKGGGRGAGGHGRPTKNRIPEGKRCSDLYLRTHRSALRCRL